MTTYEPWGNWPAHGDKYWNDVYDAAKARGWRLETHSDHNTASLICPTGDHVLAPIYSTGKSNENVAQTYGKRVERCRHGALDQSAHVQRVKEHLKNAEVLLKGVRHMVASNARLDEIEELWAEVDKNLRSADDIMADMQVADWWVDHEKEEAENTLSGTSLEGEREPESVWDGARAEVDQAQVALGEVSISHDEHETLEARIADLKEQVESLRVQVQQKRSDRD